MKSYKPGKQRKNFFNAAKHKKRKWLASHLEENLILKYDKRSLPVIKGDTVKIMRGSYKGHEDKIASVDVKKNTLEIEGITMAKADGNKIAKPIHPSNVLITKLNLTDKLRRKNLEKGLSAETKKEIEKEAEEQIKELEEEKRKEEEEKKRLEEQEKKEEEKETTEAETEQEKTKEKEEKTEKKPEVKKDSSPKKKTSAEKSKKVTEKKKTTKKTSPKEKNTTQKKKTVKKEGKKGEK